MKQALIELWRRHPVVLAAFFLAVLVALGFAGRFVVKVVYWSSPAHQNQSVEGWMTPRYIARSWQVPLEDLAERAALPHPASSGPRTLAELARAEGEPLATILERVNAALASLTPGDGPDAPLPKADGDD
jgi:hypothetical protein